jgi:predicted  nucleic acid-binding Zn-ribbon protein
MKFLHLVALILIISMTASRKVKTKSDGFRDSYVWYVYPDSDNYATCNVKKTDIENTAKKTTLCLTCSSTTADFTKLFQKVGDCYVVDFKLASNFSKTNPGGSGKYITWKLQINAAKQTKTIKFLFVYSPVTSVIEDPELNTMVGWLNTDGTNARQAFSDLKSAAQTAATSYSNNKSNVDAAANGVTGLKSQITSYNTQISGYNTSLTDNQAKLTAVEKQISDTTTLLAQYQANKETISASIASNNSDIQKANEQVTALQTQVDKGTADTTTANTNFETAKTGWTTAYSNLKTAAKGQETTVDSANTDLTTNNDVTKAKTDIDAVWP